MIILKNVNIIDENSRVTAVEIGIDKGKISELGKCVNVEGAQILDCGGKLLMPGFIDDSEGDQPWDFFGRNDVKAETPVLWPPHAKS